MRASGDTLEVRIPGFATSEVREALAEMEIRLNRGNHGVRIVLSDDVGWASIRLDPDGTIDAVEWGAH